MLHRYIPISLLCWRKIFANLRPKGNILLLGEFNARVGKSNDVDNVIGSFWELLVMIMEIY